MRFIFLF